MKIHGQLPPPFVDGCPEMVVVNLYSKHVHRLVD